MTRANTARGEVEITLDGETFILAPTFDSIGKLQAALKDQNVRGLQHMVALMAVGDVDVFREIIVCLAKSGNTKLLGNMPFHMGVVKAAGMPIVEMLNGLMEPASKNVDSAMTETRMN